MLILMDGTADAERLLDCSMKIFHNRQDHFNGAFVDGISMGNLDEIFEASEHLASRYTRSEIIEKILHTDLNNSNEFITRFVKKCDELSLRTKVFIGPGESNENLLNESMVNDLFLIGKDVFVKSNVNRHSFDAIESLMRKTKCPILLLSCEQVTFQNIVLNYDGSKRSFDAIKLFMYLMGEQMKINNVVLNVVVNENSSSNEKGVIDYLKNYKLHFAIHRVYPENYYTELLDLLQGLNSFLLVTGVNGNEIMEDMIFNKKKSFFMHADRSIFLG